MVKEDTKEMELLSERLFGHKHAWKKLRTQGVATRQTNRGAIVRRHPLSVAGCKEYMEKTLEMREKLKQEMVKKDA